MADKGFNCQDELASVGATLIIPAFLKAKKQFSAEQSEHNKTVASMPIHVERLMERIKTGIFSPEDSNFIGTYSI